jgi:mannose-6-phosphate isomerase-like protein (cupin superfamily)
MTGYTGNIQKDTLDNTYFRKVLFTGPKSQLVVMSLKPGEEIGAEVHEDHDQFIRIEQGSAKFVLGNTKIEAQDDWAMIVPAGVNHNVINTGNIDLKLYTIYSPPEHPDGTIHRTKAEAESTIK